MSERTQLEARLRRIADMEQLYERLLAHEDEEAKGADSRTGNLFEDEPDDGTRLQLGQLLLELLSERIPTALEHLVSLASQHGYNFGARIPARTVNAALLSLSHLGKVESMGDKRWRKRPNIASDNSSSPDLQSNTVQYLSALSGADSNLFGGRKLNEAKK